MDSIKQHKLLMSVEELAKGIKYTEPIETSWSVPRYLSQLTDNQDKVKIYFEIYNTLF